MSSSRVTVPFRIACDVRRSHYPGHVKFVISRVEIWGVHLENRNVRSSWADLGRTRTYSAPTTPKRCVVWSEIPIRDFRLSTVPRLDLSQLLMDIRALSSV